MIRAKRILPLLVAFSLVFSLLCIIPSAEESEKFIFVNGENLTRTADTVIIYRNLATTGQTQWGHNIVINAEGVVTDIVEGGLPEGENLAIPEGSAVVSASGTKVQWFKANIKVGTRVFYDSYTQRLFVCDANGNFDPYFENSFNISGEGNYVITDPLQEPSPDFSYDIAVSKEGFITARGSNIIAEEGGFIISAATESTKNMLIASSLLGAKCTVSEGVATISYDKNSFKRTLQYELQHSQSLVDNALAGYYPADYLAMKTLINEINGEMGNLNYRSLISLTERLENEINRFCTDSDFAEARAAFHTPRETDINQVRTIVKKAKAAGLNTLFLRITNGYATCIPMPENSKFKQEDLFGGFDVLKAYISVCAEENIVLGLSVDVYYNEYASIASPSWMTKANESGKGLEGKYFSPQNKEFKEFFIGYIEYIIGKYDISLLMLDYLRYPKFQADADLGYDSATLNEFSEKYSLPIGEVNEIGSLLFDSPHWEKWVEYKTSLVTDMAQSISDAVRAKRNDITLLASAGRDSVAHYYMQDSIGWIESGIFDGLVLSLYEGDSDEGDITDILAYSDGYVKSKGELFGAYTGKTKYFLTALEAEKPISAKAMQGAISDSRNINADGFIMSSLEGYLAQNYAGYLADTLFKNGSASAISSDSETVRAILEYSKTKINGYILSLGGIDADTAALALSKINNSLVLLDNGILTHEQAQALESDIAMLFSASAAKQSVLKEFEAVTKLTLLHREYIELPPEESEPEASTPEESENASESEASGQGSEISFDESREESDIVPEPKTKIEFGDILVYLFVGLAFAAAVTAVVIGIKRKNTRPRNAHMPKASLREKKDDEE